MRYISKPALAVVAVVAFAVAVAAGPAVASTNWSLVTAGAWHQGGAELTKSVAVKWKGKVTASDKVEEISVECEASGEGSVGPGTAGTETSWTFSKCATTKGTCGSPELVAKNLPWSMGEFGVSDGEVYAAITAGGTGAGFETKCTILGIKAADQCLGTAKEWFKNVSPGVESGFGGEALMCSIPKENAGTLSGSNFTIEATSGGKLETTKVEKAVIGSHEVALSSSKLELDAEFGPRVQCTLEGNGTVEPSGKGTITRWFVPYCETISHCAGGATVQPLNLPWGTEMVGTPPSSEEKIVNGGHGSPVWEIECTYDGVKQQQFCSLAITLKASNSSSGVNLNTGLSPHKVECSIGGPESGKWVGEIAVTLTEPLSQLALTS